MNPVFFRVDPGYLATAGVPADYIANMPASVAQPTKVYMSLSLALSFALNPYILAEFTGPYMFDEKKADTL